MPRQPRGDPSLHARCTSRFKFAWAKLCEAEQRGLRSAHVVVDQAGGRAALLANTLPEHIRAEFFAMAKELNKHYECPVCLEMPGADNFTITTCGHFYCKPCLERTMAQPEPRCGLCRRKFYPKKA